MCDYWSTPERQTRRFGEHCPALYATLRAILNHAVTTDMASSVAVPGNQPARGTKESSLVTAQDLEYLALHPSQMRALRLSRGVLGFGVDLRRSQTLGADTPQRGSRFGAHPATSCGADVVQARFPLTGSP
jgi:hypothetical protein